MKARWLSLGLGLAGLSASGEAQGNPEWDVGLRTGAGAVGDEGRPWARTAWTGAVTADVLFGRKRNRSLGVGPYWQLSTVAFEDFRAGAGGAVLWPAAPRFPLVLSSGLFVRRASTGVDPGIEGSLFYGYRSHNFHGGYSMAWGLYLAGQRSLGEDRGHCVQVGVQLDGMVLALPVVALVGGIRGLGQ